MSNEPSPVPKLSECEPKPSKNRLLKWLRRIMVVGMVLSLLGMARVWLAFREPFPDYKAELTILPEHQPSGLLRVGFAREKINPDITNTNRPVWMAGFSQNRAATAIHDDLWAVGIVLDDGKTRMGLVALDAIGFFNDDVIRVRKKLSPTSKINYAVVCSTHNHSTPDLMGLWGPHPLRSGVDPSYQSQVINTAARVLDNAAASLESTHFSLHEIELSPEGLLSDTRPPTVFDANLRFIHFQDPQTGRTQGSIIGWANHPETVWSKNTEITADFPGYLRDALERGITQSNKRIIEGIGGIHVFVNGAVGGLMTTHPSVVVKDPFEVIEYSKPTHEKTRALGYSLAKPVLERLRTTNAPTVPKASLGIVSRSISIPVSNPGFKLAPILGILKRGQQPFNHIRTEVGLITLGDCSFVCIPGEIYPELINGGVEHPAGADFQVLKKEIPPIRALLPGSVRFVLGLANDEIGYIIPKSQWDEKPPHTYKPDKKPYGEVNSVGPEAAPIIHESIAEIARTLSLDSKEKAHQ